MLNRGKPRPISPVTAIAFGVALAAVLLIALFPLFPQQFNVRVGDTASRTVRAPKSVSFESTSLTKQKQEEAAAAVPAVLVYEPRQRDRQLQEYDRVTAQVTQIRAQDTDEERKRIALERLQLSARSIDTVLMLEDDRWQGVAAEGRRVLAQQLGVSIDEASLPAAKDEIDALISVDFFANEAFLAGELVRPLVVSTMVVDDEKTEQARATARLGVSPELINVEKGDTVLAAGARVDEVAIEKLKATGIVANPIEWRSVLSASIVAIIAAIIVAMYLLVLQPLGITSERHMIALALVVAAPLLVAKFYLPTVLPDESGNYLAFVLPVAAAPILVAALLETDVAVVVSALIGVLIAFISAMLPDVSLVAAVGPLDTLRLLLVYGVAPIGGIYLVHRADRLNRYFYAGLVVAGMSFLMLLSTWFIDGNRAMAELGWMAFASGVSGVSSGVFAAGVFVTIGVLFGVTTRLQLMELSQLNAPLLRRMQDDAPGTFHHSIIVGNLAERAADLVGADPLLTRVGCYYHDIGKVLQPGMYIENQLGGEAPHETMSPETSAEIIRQHVVGGIELARRERLPARVQAFIPEHHGTRLVAYFYRKAADDNPDVDPAKFQYPGPKPQSRETAIVMLADSTEAVIRASTDRSGDRINQLVDDVIAERVNEGQLDESDLTLRDLRTIAESFKATMRGVYHPRVEYPEPSPLETRRRRRGLRLPLMPPTIDRPAVLSRRGGRRIEP